MRCGGYLCCWSWIDTNLGIRGCGFGWGLFYTRRSCVRLRSMNCSHDHEIATTGEDQYLLTFVPTVFRLIDSQMRCHANFIRLLSGKRKHFNRRHLVIAISETCLLHRVQKLIVAKTGAYAAARISFRSHLFNYMRKYCS